MRKKRKVIIDMSTRKDVRIINVKTKVDYGKQLKKNIEHKKEELRDFDLYCWDINSNSMADITNEEYEERIEKLCSSDTIIKHLFE